MKYDRCDPKSGLFSSYMTTDQGRCEVRSEKHEVQSEGSNRLPSNLENGSKTLHKVGVLSLPGMIRFFNVRFVVAVLSIWMASLAYADVYAPPKFEELKNRVVTWAASQPMLSEEKQKQLTAIWSQDGTASDVDKGLDLVIRSFALINTEASRLMTECNSSAPNWISPDVTFLSQPSLDPFFVSNLRLFVAKVMIERQMFDEAKEQLDAIDVHQVVDPASYFFSKAVTAQWLLDLPGAIQALKQLLNDVEKVPVRYSATANLMLAELSELQGKPLDEITRLMSDSQRRLDLGRAGEKVQSVQDKIISALDEIIKKIEQEQQGGGGGGGGDGEGKSNQANGEGADDSRVKGSEAPGEVDKKKFSNDGRWGNLPDKDQARAKSDLNRVFPSHYGRAIDQYFRKQSDRAAKTKR